MTTLDDDLRDLRLAVAEEAWFDLRDERPIVAVRMERAINNGASVKLVVEALQATGVLDDARLLMRVLLAAEYLVAQRQAEAA